MSTNAREALRHLTAALEAHLEAVESRRSPEDAAVDDAFDAVAEAFERYEDELDATYGEALPIVLDEGDEAYGDEDIEDDDEDDEAEDFEEDLDAHAEENEDDLDDDLEEFDLR